MAGQQLYPSFSVQDAKEAKFGPYPVNIIEHYEIPLSDGVRIACKVWFPAADVSHTCFVNTPSVLFYQGNLKPESLNSKRFPVIMEYIPYRKNDGTAERDHMRHPWFCSHGYVCIRPDIRGTGDSEGLYIDEYSPQEQEDGIEIIDFMCKQEWCNGSLGMYGKSWGGFNSLQIAFHQPKGLKAAISLYSTDNRYTDDIHYRGGCLMGSFGQLSWASTVFIYNARPPHPGNKSKWKEMWLERLKNYRSSDKIWMEHQAYDDYWKQGSICEDYSKVDIPILAIGGWHDLYSDAVWRMVAAMPNVWGLIGPWCHNWPDIAKPGPRCDYLQECLDFWDCHLKGLDNGAQNLPKMRIYQLDSQEMTPDSLDYRPGRWCEFKEENINKIELILKNDGKQLVPEININEENSPCCRSIVGASIAGAWTGEGVSLGAPGDQPVNQTIADGLSLAWETEPLKEDLHIMGYASLSVTFSVQNGTTGQIVARLTDVLENGKSTFITYGVYNLCQLGDGNGELEEGKQYQLKMDLRAIGYTVQKGNQFRLTISPSYFPFIWPSRDNIKLNIFTGLGPDKKNLSCLHVPTCPKPNQPDDRKCGFTNILNKSLIDLGPKVPTEVIRPGKAEKTVTTNLSTGSNVITWDVDDGRILFKQNGTLLDQTSKDVFEIKEDDPLSAKTTSYRTSKVEWPTHNVKTQVDIQCTLWADKEFFYLKDEITAFLNGDVIHKQEWNDKIKRVLQK